MYSRKVVIHYPAESSEKPIIYELVKRYDLVMNILKARISPRREGLLVLELGGAKENFDEGIRYLKSQGLGVEPLSKSVRQNTEKCIHCGSCTAVCPTGALHLDHVSWKVLFDPELCNGCELCVLACPVRAMEVDLF
jgi:ferredoxin